MKDHYQILGLERSASKDEVKQAYRKLAIKFHPDKNAGDVFFTERFKQIQNAYEILSNQAKKEMYDQEFDQYFNRHSNRDTYQKKEDGKNQKRENEEIERRNKEQQERQAREAKEKLAKEDAERRKKETADKLARDETEKKRVNEIKKRIELSFDDLQLIGFGTLFTIGILGIYLFFKYRSEGYIKKSHQVSWVICISLMVLFVLYGFLEFGKIVNSISALNKTSVAPMITPSQCDSVASLTNILPNTEPHYKCTKSNCNGTGTSQGKCQDCGSDLVHNQKFHYKIPETHGSTSETPVQQHPTDGNVTTTPQAPPTQNAKGVYHYTCPNGHKGGAGVASNCAQCGTALRHNQVYHVH